MVLLVDFLRPPFVIMQDYRKVLTVAGSRLFSRSGRTSPGLAWACPPRPLPWDVRAVPRISSGSTTRVSLLVLTVADSTPAQSARVNRSLRRSRGQPQAPSPPARRGPSALCGPPRHPMPRRPALLPITYPTRGLSRKRLVPRRRVGRCRPPHLSPRALPPPPQPLCPPPHPS